MTVWGSVWESGYAFGWPATGSARAVLSETAGQEGNGAEATVMVSLEFDLVGVRVKK